MYGPNKKNNVTDIKWNLKYPDLFAASFGSYDFGKNKSGGSVCLFSLKNTNYPEAVFSTESWVMCLDFHQTNCSLLCVGLYNGLVQVYDIRTSGRLPIYESSKISKRHTDPVWQVKWGDNYNGLNNFYSISSDGRILKWVLMKDRLEGEVVMSIRLVSKNKHEEENNIASLACGLCFDFNSFDPNIFIIGTEEGNIHRCSIAYSSEF